MTSDVSSIQFFQPSSLYFTSTNENLTILVTGEKYSFQSDEKGAPIDQIHDDVMDNNGGESIPLVAAEILEMIKLQSLDLQYFPILIMEELKV